MERENIQEIRIEEAKLKALALAEAKKTARKIDVRVEDGRSGTTILGKALKRGKPFNIMEKKRLLEEIRLAPKITKTYGVRMTRRMEERIVQKCTTKILQMLGSGMAKEDLL